MDLYLVMLKETL